MAIAEEHVLQIARLARLRLTPDEVGPMTEQLNTILAHVAVLAEADDEPAGPTGRPDHGGAPLRSDVRAPDRLERAPVQLAPAWQDGFFTVPRLAALEPVGPGAAAPVHAEGERRPGAARSATGESGA